MAESKHDAEPHDHGYPLTDFLGGGSAKKLTDMLAAMMGPRVQRVDLPEPGGLAGHDKPEVDTPHLGDFGTGRRPPGKGQNTSVYESLNKLFEGVSLCRLNGSLITGRKTYYAYDVGFNSAKTVGFIVRNPMDTVIVFGGERPDTLSLPVKPALPGLGRLVSLSGPAPRVTETASGSIRGERERKTTPAMMKKSKASTSGTPTRSEMESLPGKGTPPGKGMPPGKGVPPGKGIPTKRPPKPDPEAHPQCDFNARIFVNDKNQLEILQIFGSSIRIYFSKGLFIPVHRNSQGKYVPTGERQGVRLGDRVITLARGKRPRVSAPLEFGENLVQIAGQALILRLKTVRLGGTFAEPKMIFDHAEAML